MEFNNYWESTPWVDVVGTKRVFARDTIAVDALATANRYTPKPLSIGVRMIV